MEHTVHIRTFCFVRRARGADRAGRRPRRVGTTPRPSRVYYDEMNETRFFNRGAVAFVRSRAVLRRRKRPSRLRVRGSSSPPDPDPRPPPPSSARASPFARARPPRRVRRPASAHAAHPLTALAAASLSARRTAGTAAWTPPRSSHPDPRAPVVLEPEPAPMARSTSRTRTAARRCTRRCRGPPSARPPIRPGVVRFAERPGNRRDERRPDALREPHPARSATIPPRGANAAEAP